jgi:broad specificity phosphatase PhoE
MRLLLIRHGESVGNFENRLQGQEDYDLTDLGRQQAALTGERLACEGVTAVYASPLLRAVTTARLIGAALGREPVILPDLSEYHFGELAGKTYADLRQHFAGQQTPGATPQERVYPGEEGRDNFYRRVTEAAARIIAGHPGETVAIVSHGGPIALLGQSVLGLPYTRPMPFAVGNCSITAVDAADTNPSLQASVLVSLNDTCHLDPLHG